jgi:hypothetical protein
MAINVFISYSSADEAALKALETHLAALKHSGLINPWSAHQIGFGQEVRAITDLRLDRADLILLLISPDFLHSEHHYGVELARAMERHYARSARVVPIIIRPVDWTGTPIAGLKMLPDGARPVTSSGWETPDKAWFNVAVGLRGVVEEMLGRASSYSAQAGRSFVQPHDERSGMQRPQSAPSFVAPSSRAPLSQSPSSSRHSTHSQPAISIPVPPRSSQRSAHWPTAPVVPRTQAPQKPSRLPLLALGSLVFVAAGISAGVWAFNRHADPSPSNATSYVLPTPSPVPPLNRDPSPAPTPAPAGAAGPCCGGSGCEPAHQDTKGSSCDDKPGGCSTCASLRTRVDGACRDPLARSQRFLLRLARVDLAGMSPTTTRVCVRLAGDTVANRQCTSAADASDLHHGIPGAELSTRLPISIATLVDAGRGIDIELEIAGRPFAVRAAAIIRDHTLLRSALCRGFTHDVGAAHISFYLDDR